MKAAAFLGALKEVGRVAEAARMVGMSRQSAYRLRERLGEGGLFAQVWDRALAQARAERAARRSRAGGRGRKVTPLPPERDVFGIGR